MGNAEIVGLSDAKTSSASASIGIKFKSDGTLDTPVTSNLYYAIRTNNPVGLEVEDYKDANANSANQYVYYKDTSGESPVYEIWKIGDAAVAGTAWESRTNKTKVTAVPETTTAKGTFVVSGGNYYVALKDDAGTSVADSTAYRAVVPHDLDSINVAKNDIEADS